MILTHGKPSLQSWLASSAGSQSQLKRKTRRRGRKTITNRMIPTRAAMNLIIEHLLSGVMKTTGKPEFSPGAGDEEPGAGQDAGTLWILLAGSAGQLLICTAESCPADPHRFP